MERLYPPDDLPDTESGWTFFKRFRRVDRLEGSAVDALQATHLRDALTHHARHSAGFQRRLAAAKATVSDFSQGKDLSRLPVMTRADVQAAGSGLFSSLVPFDHLPVRTSQTSGSTGQPVIVRRTRVNALLNEAATLRDHSWWGRPLNGGRITMIRPQFRKVEEVAAIPGNSANIAQRIPIDTDISVQADLIAGFRPQVLLVYPNNLAALLDLWEAEQRLPSSVRHLKSIGETVSPELHTRASKLLGLPIEDSYSSEEFGLMALQCPASGQYHVMAESHVIEIVRDDGSACGAGEMGRVVVTDLHNLATPMIRYAIGDWAEVGTPCPCGRNLPTLKRILGRERNLVRLPDGRRHWPLVGFQRFGEVAPVRQYQVVQESLTDVELRLVVEGEVTPAQSAALAQIVQSALGHPFQVRVSLFAERLPLGPNGKFEEFVCRVPANA
ncbi:MAG: phenylacetate--CoA ligase family protein [Schleiferiaceae bacterium]